MSVFSSDPLHNIWQKIIWATLCCLWLWQSGLLRRFGFMSLNNQTFVRLSCLSDNPSRLSGRIMNLSWDFVCLRSLKWGKGEQIKEIPSKHIQMWSFWYFTSKPSSCPDDVQHGSISTFRLFHRWYFGKHVLVFKLWLRVMSAGAVMGILGVKRMQGGSSWVRLWCNGCNRCQWRRWCGGAYRRVLVACTVADVWRERIRVQRRVPSWSHVGSASWTGRRDLAGLGTEDESGLVLLLQVGNVFHHGFAVRDGQLVGAVGHQVKVAGDEDDGERKHGNNDQSKAHDQSPGRVALEAFLGLKRWRLKSKLKQTVKMTLICFYEYILEQRSSSFCLF